MHFVWSAESARGKRIHTDLKTELVVNKYRAVRGGHNAVHDSDLNHSREILNLPAHAMILEESMYANERQAGSPGRSRLLIGTDVFKALRFFNQLGLFTSEAHALNGTPIPERSYVGLDGADNINPAMLSLLERNTEKLEQHAKGRLFGDESVPGVSILFKKESPMAEGAASIRSDEVSRYSLTNPADMLNDKCTAAGRKHLHLLSAKFMQAELRRRMAMAAAGGGEGAMALSEAQIKKSDKRADLVALLSDVRAKDGVLAPPAAVEYVMPADGIADHPFITESAVWNPAEFDSTDFVQDDAAVTHDGEWRAPTNVRNAVLQAMGGAAFTATAASALQVESSSRP